ncbi:transketolase [Tsuneonella sp. HG222]
MNQALQNAPDTRALALKLRKHVVRMTHLGQSSHVGSCLSMADIMAVLYGEVLNVVPTQPKWPDRDRFILSKGHAGACVYAALAERGFFPPSELDRHYQNGSIFSGHVSHKGVPGVEMSTGSLGHGLPVATGMAYRLRLQGSPARVFCVLSDGECDEGSNWEAFLFAAQHKLENLVVVVDFNGIQSLAPTGETIGLEPFHEKLAAFNWGVKRVDGHDHAALSAALGNVPFEAGKPSILVAETTKGKGVSFMENAVLWHYRFAHEGQEYDDAMAELAAAENALKEAGHA